MNRAILLATAGAAIIGAAFGLNYAINREETAAPPPADITTPAPAEEAGEATASAPQPETTTPGEEPAPETAAPPPGPTPPQFDIVRIDPAGSTVIAGRAPPESEVTILLNGEPAGSVTADARGEWVLLPDRPLPPGSHELSLSSVHGGEPPVVSDEMVVVVVPEPNKDIAGRETDGTGQALAILVPREGDGASTVLQVPPAAAETPVDGEPMAAASSAGSAPADAAPSAAAAAAGASGVDAASATAATPESAPPAPGEAGEVVAGASGTPALSSDNAVPQPDASTATVTASSGANAPALAGTEADVAASPELTASQTGAPAPAAVASASPSEAPAGIAAAPGAPSAESPPATDSGAAAETVDGSSGEASQPPASATAEGGSEVQQPASATAEGGSEVQQMASGAAAEQVEGVSTGALAGDAAASAPGAQPAMVADGTTGAVAPLADAAAVASAESSQIAAAAPLPGTPVAAAAAALAATQAIGEGVTSGGLVLDSVDYDATGNVVIGGRAEPGSILQVYLDNRLVGTTLAERTGRWNVRPERSVGEGLHTLRVDQVRQTGEVMERVESPFSRAEPVTALPGQTVVIVQPGNSLWRIARRSYGDGLRYSVLYQANRSQIADPDLIYPGQVFVVPKIVKN